MQFTSFTRHVCRLRFFSQHEAASDLVFLFLSFKLLGLDQISTSSITFNPVVVFSAVLIKVSISTCNLHVGIAGLVELKWESKDLLSYSINGNHLQSNEDYFVKVL